MSNLYFDFIKLLKELKQIFSSDQSNWTNALKKLANHCVLFRIIKRADHRESAEEFPL